MGTNPDNPVEAPGRRPAESPDGPKVVAVTGAGGSLGRRLCQVLSDQGHRVVAQILPGEAQPVCERCIPADIRSMAEVQRLADPDVDVLYHLAAHANVPGSVEDPRMDFEVNTLGTFHMLELARQMSLECFLFVSTVSVLDPSNSLPMAEDAVCGPSAPYPAAKLAGEAYCRAYCRSYGVPARVVRLFNVYGPGLRRLVVYDLITKLLRTPTRIELLGDGNQVRDFLYVDDALAGLQLVVERGQDGEIYHVGCGKPTSIRDLVEVIIRSLGLADVDVVPTGRNRRGDMPQWYADISKVRALGFQARTDLPSGIARTIEWIRQRGTDAC